MYGKVAVISSKSMGKLPIKLVNYKTPIQKYILCDHDSNVSSNF